MHMPDTADTQTVSVKMCSKCHQNPRADTNNGNPWCKECRADYQRIYAEGRAERVKDTGYAKGVEAMRASQIAKLDEMASWATLEVRDVITWIREFPAPRPN